MNTYIIMTIYVYNESEVMENKFSTKQIFDAYHML